MVRSRTFTDIMLGLTVKTTGNKVRDNCTGMVYTSLGIVSLPSYSFSSSFVSVGLGSDDESSLIMEKAVAIERLTFLGNEEQVSAKYKSRIRSVTFNLKEKANSALRSSILAGDLAVEEFCKMSVEVYPHTPLLSLFTIRKWHRSRKRGTLKPRKS